MLLNFPKSGDFICLYVHFWKKDFFPSFVSGHKVSFYYSESKALKRAIKTNKAIVCWASKVSDSFKEKAKKLNVPVIFVEDGFIRSVGLGVKLRPPSSLVFDAKGIYYDPHNPSDLETLLENHIFTEQEIKESEKLKEALINLNISKYNVGEDGYILDNPHNKKVILVPGQVEDDQSIKKGTIDITKNLDLLREVRNQNPDALIIYKPHPDVLSGYRKGHIEDKTAKKLADVVALDTSIIDLINISEEVHTMTSLTGFEALIREKKVHCYGIPFYANWGLTVDRHQSPRRTKKRTLLELISATLCLYPTYVHPVTGALCDAITVVNSLHDMKTRPYKESFHLKVIRLVMETYRKIQRVTR